MKKIILVFLLCVPLVAQSSLISRAELGDSTAALRAVIGDITDPSGQIDDSLNGYTKYIPLDEGGVVNKGIVLFYNAVGQYVKSSLVTIWDDSLSVDWNGYDLKEIDSLIVDGKGVIDSLIVGGYASITGFSNTSQTKSFISDSITTEENARDSAIDDSLNNYSKPIFTEGTTQYGIAVFYTATGNYITSVPITISPTAVEGIYTVDFGNNIIDNVASVDLDGEDLATKIESGDATNQSQINTLSTNVSAIYDSILALRNYINSFLPLLTELDAPTLTSVTADNDSAIIRLVFNFDASSDSGVIQRGLSPSVFANIDTVDETTTSYTDSTVLGNTSYYYRLYSYNTLATSSYSAVLNTTTVDTASSPEVIADYYVDSDIGDNGNDGLSPSTAWKTIGKVNLTTLISGDTVAFKGTFTDDQLDCKSGVTYTSYGDNRAKLQPAPLTAEDYVINAYDKDTVTISNLEIVGRLWINAKSSSYFLVDNCYLHHYENTDNYMAVGTAPFYADYTYNAYMEVKNTIMIGGFPSTQQLDMINLTRSSYYYFHDNYLRDITHNVFMTNRGRFGVIRHNRVFNAYHSNVGLQWADSMMVIDYNYFEQQGIGSDENDYNIADSDMGYFGFMGTKNMARFNVIKKAGAQRITGYNYLPAIEMVAGSAFHAGFLTPVKTSRFYNNTIYNTYGSGMRLYLASDGTEFSGNYFFNNAFVKANDTSWYPLTSYLADSAVVLIADEAPSYNFSGNIIEYNYFGAKDSNIYHFNESPYSGSTNTAFTGITFQNNLSGGSDVSVFSSPDDSLTTYTYWDIATSRGEMFDSLSVLFTPTGALVDAGRHHATITDNATGTTITVDDPYVFFDGDGWLDADSIVVTNNSSGAKQYARISTIDYGLGELYLEQSVTVSVGFYVDVMNPYTGVYQGTKPDIGISED